MVVGGITGNVWLEHMPEPTARQSLGGDWDGTQLPGVVPGPFAKLDREFVPDASKKSLKAMLYVEVGGGNIIPGMFFNGRMMTRDFAGRHCLVDITPYLHWNAPNSIKLNLMYPSQTTTVKAVEIRYYEPGVF
jgi:hypothetical protein